MKKSGNILKAFPIMKNDSKSQSVYQGIIKASLFQMDLPRNSKKHNQLKKEADRKKLSHNEITQDLLSFIIFYH